MASRVAPAPLSDADRATRATLWMLLLVYILNFLDRQIVNILAEPIRLELGLSDTQLGLLTGLAFALFYAVLGIPIARWADRPGSNRVGLIAVSLALWSGMTALCGLAQNFAQLLLARMGVGVGEAGCTPAAHSLIADAVPAERRASAIAFYGMGVPIGGLLGMVIGGLLADHVGWRAAFLAVGLPGVLLALVFWRVVPEPRHAAAAVAARAAGPRSAALPWRDAWAELRASRAFLPMLVGAAFVAFLGYGKGVWAAVFFIRTHGLTPGETGVWLGGIAGLAGIGGTWLGGRMADRLGARDKAWILLVPAAAMLAAAPLLYFAYAAADWRWALALLVLPTVANSLYYGPVYSCAQGLVSPRARAVAASLLLFAQNLVGLGLGPLFFGMLSDGFKPVAGAESVRWVLYGAAFLGVIPAFFFWRAAKHLRTELRAG